MQKYSKTSHQTKTIHEDYTYSVLYICLLCLQYQLFLTIFCTLLNFIKKSLYKKSNLMIFLCCCFFSSIMMFVGLVILNNTYLDSYRSIPFPRAPVKKLIITHHFLCTYCTSDSVVEVGESFLRYFFSYDTCLRYLFLRYFFYASQFIDDFVNCNQSLCNDNPNSCARFSYSVMLVILFISTQQHACVLCTCVSERQINFLDILLPKCQFEFKIKI